MNLRSVSEQSQTCRSSFLLSLIHNIDRFVKIISRSLNVAMLQPPLYRPIIDLDGQGDPIIHRHCQRLRSPHLAKAGCEDDSTFQTAPKMLPSRSSKRLVSALYNSLCSNVIPRTSRH